MKGSRGNARARAVVASVSSLFSNDIGGAEALGPAWLRAWKNGAEACAASLRILTSAARDVAALSRASDTRISRRTFTQNAIKSASASAATQCARLVPDAAFCKSHKLFTAKIGIAPDDASEKENIDLAVQTYHQNGGCDAT